MHAYPEGRNSVLWKWNGPLNWWVEQEADEIAYCESEMDRLIDELNKKRDEISAIETKQEKAEEEQEVLRKALRKLINTPINQ